MSHQRKKTKIVATLGPATNSKEIITKMIQEGVNVFRINFSHANYKEVAQRVKYIREINEELGFNAAILGDLQGPKLRVGLMKEGVVVNEGDEIIFATGERFEGTKDRVYMTYDRFPQDAKPGEKILLDDGKLMFEVVSTDKKSEVKARVIQGGPLKSKKGVNLPNTNISQPALTEKDIEDVMFAIKLEVDKVKQAIHEGRLWEYVIKKARAHPKLFEMIEVMTENSEFLGLGTPKFKERAIFLFSKEDQYRPEVQSFHKIVRKFKSKKKKLLITKESTTKPGYLSQQYLSLKKKVKEFETFQVCQYNPHMGLIPIEISDIFPAAHHESSRMNYDPKEFTEFQKTWEDFFKKNKFSEIHYDKKDEFLKYFVKMLPKEIKKKSFG
jgi:hypothetical protein